MVDENRMKRPPEKTLAASMNLSSPTAMWRAEVTTSRAPWRLHRDV